MDFRTIPASVTISVGIFSYTVIPSYVADQEKYRHCVESKVHLCMYTKSGFDVTQEIVVDFVDTVGYVRTYTYVRYVR